MSSAHVCASPFAFSRSAVAASMSPRPSRVSTAAFVLSSNSCAGAKCSIRTRCPVHVWTRAVQEKGLRVLLADVRLASTSPLPTSPFRMPEIRDVMQHMTHRLRPWTRYGSRPTEMPRPWPGGGSMLECDERIIWIDQLSFLKRTTSYVELFVDDCVARTMPIHFFFFFSSWLLCEFFRKIYCFPGFLSFVSNAIKLNRIKYVPKILVISLFLTKREWRVYNLSVGNLRYLGKTKGVIDTFSELYPEPSVREKFVSINSQTKATTLNWVGRDVKFWSGVQ